jgi:CheY-like chemotaxis protein
MEFLIVSPHKRKKGRGLEMSDKKILVIEDNELNLKLVKNLLLLEKYTVLEAVNAEKGLELARKEQPDLILMDIQLPGMDGLKATHIIKHDDVLKNIPVVALTSYAMEGDEEKVLAAGCNGYISKPIDTKRFRDTISQYFD